MEFVIGFQYKKLFLIHRRDLKPENFLYVNPSPESPIKVIDFGLAKVFKDPDHPDDKTKKVMTSRVGTVNLISFLL